MNLPRVNLSHGFCIGLSVLTLFATVVARGHPYASGLTNSAGTIKFVLNEAADSVKVAFDNGTSTNDLGTLASLGSSTTYAPFKCVVGPDDMVDVGDSSGLAGSGTTAGEPVWMTDPDVTQSNKLFVSGSSATNNRAGPCVSTPFVTGSLAAG